MYTSGNETKPEQPQWQNKKNTEKKKNSNQLSILLLYSDMMKPPRKIKNFPEDDVSIPKRNATSAQNDAILITDVSMMTRRPRPLSAIIQGRISAL